MFLFNNPVVIILLVCMFAASIVSIFDIISKVRVNTLILMLMVFVTVGLGSLIIARDLYKTGQVILKEEKIVSLENDKRILEDKLDKLCLNVGDQYCGRILNQ